MIPGKKKAVFATGGVILVFAALTGFLFFNTLGENIVAAVNGQPVTEQEFLAACDRNRGDVFSQLCGEYNGDGFWLAKLAGGRPVDILFQRALDECTQQKVILILARQNGLADDITYKGLLNGMKRENQNRKEKLARGEPVYGPQQFSMDEYLGWYFLNLEAELKQTVGEANYDALLRQSISRASIELRPLYDTLKEDYK